MMEKYQFSKADQAGNCEGHHSRVGWNGNTLEAKAVHAQTRLATVPLLWSEDHEPADQCLAVPDRNGKKAKGGRSVKEKQVQEEAGASRHDT